MAEELFNPVIFLLVFSNCHSKLLTRLFITATRSSRWNKSKKLSQLNVKAIFGFYL